MHHLPHFGFYSWTLVPFRDESALGFFCRMVQEEGEHNMLRFCELNDLRVLNHADALAFLEKYPFPHTVKVHLRRSVVTVEPRQAKYSTSRVFLRGEVVNNEDASLSRRRWCRACLHESDHRRIWFDLTVFERCPYHGLPIESVLASGEPIMNYRTGYSDVFNEGTVQMPRNLRVGGFYHYVLGRLDCEDRFAVPTLDPLPLCDVIDAVSDIGRLLSRNWQWLVTAPVTAEEAEMGFQAFSSGPAHLTRTLIEWAKSCVPPHKLERDIGTIFTWAYRHIKLGRNKIDRLLLDALHAANAALKGSPREITDDYVVSDRIALDVVAPTLRLDVNTLSFIVKELGLVEPARKLNRRRGLAKVDLPIVEKFLDKLIDKDELRSIIGLGTYVPLIQPGFVRIYRGGIRGRPGPWFNRADAEEILRRLNELPRTQRYGVGRPFTAMARDKRSGRLAIDVLNGKVEVVSFARPELGFRGLVVNCDSEIYRRIDRYKIGQDEIRAIEAAKILGVANRCLRCLTDVGAIKFFIAHDGKRVFYRSDVERFASEHITVYPVAEMLDVRLNTALKRLDAAGVRPVVKISVGKTRNSFYKKSDVTAALGLGRQLLDLDVPELQTLWSGMLAAAEREFPMLRAPRKFPFGGCWCATSYSQKAVKFHYFSKTRQMAAKLSPTKMGGRQFTFNIDDDIHMETFKDLFSALIEKNERDKAKSAACSARMKQWRQHRGPGREGLPPPVLDV